jgi:hypothetical protein
MNKIYIRWKEMNKIYIRWKEMNKIYIRWKEMNKIYSRWKEIVQSFMHIYLQIWIDIFHFAQTFLLV